MNNLRELTKEEHRRAERTTFMNRMLKKNITSEQYYVYIKNQLMMYTALEYYASEQNIFDGNMLPIMRGTALLEDVLEMEVGNDFDDAPTMNATQEYVEYMKKIANDPAKLMAHVYVRHMGDLSGGQIIKKLVPGPTHLYEFDGDPEDLKNTIREKLHDGLEAEAKVCFNMVQKFLEELEEYFDNMEQIE